ncbi:PASTA domain-containing protein [Aquimarina agarivorans]|uniref:PASTA domain-containing protein n=1 Tax=Aquimarina agarivorans TaxID=980584 RepID=UPI00031B368B|nr:PASTA domain-containing protein [Aquimarina agarivorans]
MKTNHDQRIAVPNLEKLTLEKASDLLEASKLMAKVQDSANFNPSYPPFSVIEQNPKAGSFVKEDRKIYLVLNPSNYRKIIVPNIIQKTRRQAEPTLKALGFKVGKVIYRPNIARDMVLEMQHKGKVVKPDGFLRKTSVIDLVVGDGSE